MTKKEYIETFGEDPCEMFGPAWKLVLEDFEDNRDNHDCKESCQCHKLNNNQNEGIKNELRRIN